MSPRVLLPVLALLLAGCSLLPRPLVPVRYYCIEPAAIAPKAAPGQGDNILAVRALDSASNYRERIFFRRDGLAAGFHEFDRWAEAPSDMVTRALRRSLQAAGAARLVVDDRLVRRPDLQLDGRLTRFDEVQGKDHWSAECEVELVLKKADDGTVLLSTLLAASQQAKAKTTAAAAEAMNAAVADLAAKATAAIAKTITEHAKTEKK